MMRRKVWLMHFFFFRPKLDASKREEEWLMRKCKKRLDHLVTMLGVDDIEAETMIQWTNTRLYRQLVDCMMRHGQIETAKAIASGEYLDVLFPS